MINKKTLLEIDNPEKLKSMLQNLKHEDELRVTTKIDVMRFLVTVFKSGEEYRGKVLSNGKIWIKHEEVFGVGSASTLTKDQFFEYLGASKGSLCGDILDCDKSAIKRGEISMSFAEAMRAVEEPEAAAEPEPVAEPEVKPEVEPEEPAAEPEARPETGVDKERFYAEKPPQHPYLNIQVFGYEDGTYSHSTLTYGGDPLNLAARMKKTYDLDKIVKKWFGYEDWKDYKAKNYEDLHRKISRDPETGEVTNAATFFPLHAAFALEEKCENFSSEDYEAVFFPNRVAGRTRGGQKFSSSEYRIDNKIKEMLAKRRGILGVAGTKERENAPGVVGHTLANPKGTQITSKAIGLAWDRLGACYESLNMAISLKPENEFIVFSDGKEFEVTENESEAQQIEFAAHQTATRLGRYGVVVLLPKKWRTGEYLTEVEKIFLQRIGANAASGYMLSAEGTEMLPGAGEELIAKKEIWRYSYKDLIALVDENQCGKLNQIMFAAEGEINNVNTIARAKKGLKNFFLTRYIFGIEEDDKYSDRETKWREDMEGRLDTPESQDALEQWASVYGACSPDAGGDADQAAGEGAFKPIREHYAMKAKRKKSSKATPEVQAALDQMVLSDSGRRMLRGSEGFRPYVYADNQKSLVDWKDRAKVKNPTIGIGHLIGSWKKDLEKSVFNQETEKIFQPYFGNNGLPGGTVKMTEDQAEELYGYDVEIHINRFIHHLTRVPTQNQFDAMVSFVFQVGSLSGAMVKKFNAGDIKSYNKVAGEYNKIWRKATPEEIEAEEDLSGKGGTFKAATGKEGARIWRAHPGFQRRRDREARLMGKKDSTGGVKDKPHWDRGEEFRAASLETGEITNKMKEQTALIFGHSQAGWDWAGGALKKALEESGIKTFRWAHTGAKDDKLATEITKINAEAKERETWAQKRFPGIHMVQFDHAFLFLGGNEKEPGGAGYKGRVAKAARKDAKDKIISFVISNLGVPKENITVILAPINTDDEWPTAEALHIENRKHLEGQGVYVYPKIKASKDSFRGAHIRKKSPEAAKLASDLTTRALGSEEQQPAQDESSIEEGLSEFNFEVLDNLIEEVFNEASE